MNRIWSMIGFTSCADRVKVLKDGEPPDLEAL